MILFTFQDVTVYLIFNVIIISKYWLQNTLKL